MRSALKSVAGTEDVEVDFDHSRATVSLRDPASAARLCPAVVEAGYGCSSL